MNYYIEVMDIVNDLIKRERAAYLAAGMDDNAAARVAYSVVIGRLQVQVASLLYCHKDQEEAQKELEWMRKL